MTPIVCWEKLTKYELYKQLADRSKHVAVDIAV